MRSKSLTPLLQVAEFLKIDPWVFAGINKNNSNKCGCIMQYTYQAQAYQKNQFWARDNFEDSVIQAENTFIQEIGEFPAPYFLQKEFSASFYDTFVKRSAYKPKSFELDYGKDAYFGIRTMTLIDVVNSDKSDLELFEFVFTVPDGTTKDELRFFYTNADLDYEDKAHPEPNDFHLEIRPVTNISIVGTNCTVKIPSYLLKKPSLDETGECATHEADTYLDSIFVYRDTVNVTDAGYFIGKENCGQGEECVETTRSFCVTTRPVGYRTVFVPELYKNVSYSGFRADKAYINYTSGYNLVKRRVKSDISTIIMYLAINNMTFGEDCGCNYEYAYAHMNWLRELDKTKIVEAKNSVGDQYEINMTDTMREYLLGLPPTNGNLSAFRMLRNLIK